MKLLAIILVLLLAATAQAFTLSIPEKTVNVPTQGSRDVIITLVSDRAETVAVNLIDSKTWTSLSENLVKFERGETKEVVLTVSPFQDTVLGLHKVTLIAESLTTKQGAKKDIFISVFKGEVVDIEKIVVAGDTKPTGNVAVAVFIKNYKTVPSNEVIVRGSVASPSKKIFEFTEVIDNINPDGRVNRTQSFVLQKYAEAGTYKVVATLIVGNETREVTQTFNVAAKPVVAIGEERMPLVFGFSKKITITNGGNEPASLVTVTETISPVEGMFFAGDQPTSVQDSSYVWLVSNVSPGQIVVIDYRIDYMPLFVFIVALIIIAWILFFKLRTVRIKKYIMQKKGLQEGEEFTVGIEVKNASGGKHDEIAVRDFVPPIFEIKEAQSLAPSKKKTAAGTELTWKLKDVHHREERLVSYKIVPLFGVHGQIRLPRASASFKQNKREMTNKSTFAVIGVATEKEEGK